MTDAVLEESEEAFSAPVSVASSWGSMLSIGGLLLVVGTIGFSTVQMSYYEERIAELESADVFIPEQAITPDSALDEIDAAETDGALGLPTPTEAGLLPSEASPPPAAGPAKDDLQAARDRIAALEGENTKLTEALQNAQERLAALPAAGAPEQSGKCVDELRSRDARIAELTRENRRLNETCQASKP